MGILRNWLNIIIVLCVCLGWVCTEGARVRESGEVYSHTIELSSLFPSSSSCDLSPLKASKTKSSMFVLHRYGPCSSLATRSPDQAEILSRDQARVNSIHSKLSQNSADRVLPSQSTDLPAKSGRILGSGNYFVTIGIGTPKRDLSLAFDTGSNLIWTQCEPCAAGSCYPQKEPKFNPSSSSSYSNVTCSSPVCASLSSPGSGIVGRCSAASNCIYGTQYGDGSFSIGNLATEKFTLTPSDVFSGVNFGCGQANEGLFRGIAGLLGLGRGQLSLPSQTAKTYNNIFSYCLPSTASNTGHLTFGSAGISNSVRFTPISSAFSSLYGIDIVGISVGDQNLAIPVTVFSTPKGIIDSGTVITRLPPKAYAALRDAFRKQMSNYKMTSGQSILDTCYDFTGVKTVMIPKISFSFGGGTVVDLSKGALFPLGNSVACLGFAGNSRDNQVAIFGNTQQKTLQVVYDVPGKRIGFAPNGCS